MSKFCNTILLCVAALLLISASHKVFATENPALQTIYQCTAANGKVTFQDFTCKKAKKEKLIKLSMYQASKPQVSGLRPYELTVLERAFVFIQREQELQCDLRP